MFLTDGFSATGELRLLSARIDGQPTSHGGTFTNPDGTVINLQGASVAAELFWHRLAQPPQGSVDLRRASVNVLFDDWSSWPADGSLLLEVSPLRDRPTDSRHS